MSLLQALSGNLELSLSALVILLIMAGDMEQNPVPGTYLGECMCLCVYARACVCACAHSCVCVFVCMHIRVYVHALMHACICVHAYVCSCVHV